MIYTSIGAAEGRWRKLTGAYLVALVRAGARFENGELVEGSEQKAAAWLESRSTTLDDTFGLMRDPGYGLPRKSTPATQRIGGRGCSKPRPPIHCASFFSLLPDHLADYLSGEAEHKQAAGSMNPDQNTRREIPSEVRGKDSEHRKPQPRGE